MKIIDIQQGSDEWLAYRRAHYNASDAAAMLGISPYKKRNELLREYAAGITPEPDEATRRRFKEGHRLEDEARLLVAEIICEELRPVVGEWDDAEKEGLPLSASLDGVTMDGNVLWEHKTMNQQIQNGMGIPDYIMAQIQQQFIVSGAQKALFTASDNDGVILREEVAAPDPEWRKKIIAGWRQFQKDLADWKPEEGKAEAIGKTPETLPVLSIRAEGRIIASNLTEYIAGARAIVAGIKTELTTDQDFATAEKTVKWAKSAEESIDTAKAALLSQTADIGAAINQIDALKSELRDVRLKLDKAVKVEKEARKTEHLHKALDAFRAHLLGLQKEIAGIYPGISLVVPQPYFGEAIKGLRTLESIQNALDTALANGKIEANDRAGELREKLEYFKREAADFRDGFPDLQTLLAKPLEDFQTTVTLRIKEAEEREAAKLEAERERIRAEEAAKARAEAKAGEDAGDAAVSVRKATVREYLMVETDNPLPPMDGNVIRAFLKTRDFGKETNKIRAVLVEFVKFCAEEERMAACDTLLRVGAPRLEKAGTARIREGLEAQ
ncbi:MAG: YqaJ viral recombinase family protein [Zoogloeaceae bacterium]|jgi:putative phage-type endonuclease|nr:YqaJ viral recombinase family protein [Zoogloeaceae bacterium]